MRELSFISESKALLIEQPEGVNYSSDTVPPLRLLSIDGTKLSIIESDDPDLKPMSACVNYAGTSILVASYDSEGGDHLWLLDLATLELQEKFTVSFAENVHIDT